MMHSGATYDIVFITTLVMSTITFGQSAELTYVINEESPAMTRVGNVLVDTDVRNIVSPTELTDLRFSFLTEGNPQSSLLWINSTSGELRTSSRINREQICPRLSVCELKVQTVAQALLGAFFKIVHVKVTVKDINDNVPTFDPSTYAVKVVESEVSGTYFRIPTASDIDGEDNSVVKYAMLTTTAPFTLVVDEGGSALHGIRIRLDTTLDRETVASYQLHVLAVDNGNPRLTGTLTVNIEVIDVNDHAPVFQQRQYNVSVSDDVTVDSSVLVVKAVDLDGGDNGLVTYILPTSQGDKEVLEMFYINRSTGEIKVKASVDIYAGRSYRMTIQARDCGNPYKTSSTEVTISVLDKHNSQPEILLNVLGTGGVAQVSELAEIGRAVAHVAVSDPDSAQSSNGQVSCFLDSTDQFQLQAMDVQQFKVILTKRLDRERHSHHSVTVICEDSGAPPLNASATFLVEVGDENDNAPAFSYSFYTVEVTEGKANTNGDKSNAILTVQASDKDLGLNAQITYRLADDADSDFGIYTDGSIVVTNPAGLDREDKVKGGVRNLMVLAVDSGRVPMTGTTRVVVTIKDINDNPPRFSEPVYFFTVKEDSPIGQTVGNISATDADLESSGVVCFKIHHRNTDTVPFQISPEGAVKLSAGLDREQTSGYEFLVVAYDMGKPVRLSSTVVVRIKVTDVNDNSPTFIFPSHNNYTVYISHALSKHAVVTTLLATDSDEGINSEVVFTLESINGSKHFEVEPSSGQVYLAQPLTEKDVGLHILTVIAGNPAADIHATTSTLYVIVYESNTTVSHQATSLGVRNMVVIVVLVVITGVLAFTILVTILLLRFVDKDKQRKFYSTKAEEAKVESKLKHMNLYLASDQDTFTSASEMTTGSKDGGRKRKEVSFSLEEGSNAGSSHRMTSSSLSEACDFSSKRVHEKIISNGADLYHDDSGSDTSGDISACDSGKGGSDVELQSNLGQTKLAGEVTPQSQHSVDPRKHLNFVSSGQSNTRCQISRNVTPSAQLRNGRQHVTPVVGSDMFQNTPSSAWPRPYYYHNHSHLPAHENNTNKARYNQNPTANGFHQNMNQAQRNNENHSCQEPMKSHKRTFGVLNQNNQITSPSNRNNGCIYLTEATPSFPHRSDSISCTEEANTWDCDTTTSGSYVVDPSDLYSEIDSFSFGNMRDIVV